MSKNLEFIKNEHVDRYTVFPIRYKNLWEFYKKHLAVFWTVEEIRLSDDIEHWKSLSENERYFLKNVLAFFAASDGIVMENINLNFASEVEIPEARQFYAIQNMIEAIHSESYATLIDTYIRDSTEKQNLFRAIDTIDSVKQKANWAIKWINNSCAFEQRLLAFICVEGIFFSGSFCAIYWLKSRGLMPGLCTTNEFIARDENIHTEFAIELYSMLPEKLDVETVHNIFKEAVGIEEHFITKSLPVSLLGMNCELMKKYIRYVADRWLVLLGYSKLYNSENPFTFMQMISVNAKENFFEHNVSQYNRAGVGNTSEQNTISFDAEF